MRLHSILASAAQKTDALSPVVGYGRLPMPT